MYYRMKEIINLPGPTALLRDAPIPSPNADQVLIKVVVSGSNPKDWKVPEVAKNADSPLFARYAHVRDGVNQGDDIAGVVEAVGKNVVEFKPGDRVGAFHEMLMPGGSYAEYALAWAHTTFHLPKETSFEEAATIPLAGLTAVVALYHHLALPFPWRPATTATPLVIYGGSTAVGAFAIKLARRSNIHPIIAVAGKGASYITPLLDPSRGDVVVDYRAGGEATAKGIRAALGAEPLEHVLDTIVSDESTRVLRGVIAPGGNINSVLPQERDVAPGVATNTWVSAAHEAGGPDDCRELCYLFCRWFSRALRRGEFSGHPFEVRPRGLAGVQDALRDLMQGKASAVKYVFRIGDTPA
jgi:NADPH:quinone reductase-like Zn-dependent oxidoreductase